MAANPRSADEEYQYFRRAISSMLPLQCSAGLEIGPFDRPIFSKSEANVEYLDYRSTDELRVMAASAAGHSPDFVVDVDYVVPGSGDWSAVPDGRYDWLLSSHALEHSPNLIGFLRIMASKLKPGGLLISLLPDKRATFDVHRPPTSLGRIIEDYLADAKKPRSQSVFDSQFYNRPVSIQQAKQEAGCGYELLMHNGNFYEAMASATSALTGYVDAHNYVFTSESFYENIVQICLANLIPCTCVMHLPTRPGHMTFLNVLRKSSADYANIALGKTALQSSVSEWSIGATPVLDATNAINGRLTSRFQCHTALEDEPWWQVDLGSRHTVAEVRVFNRLDVGQDQLSTFELSTSDNGTDWALAHRKFEDSLVGGADGFPFTWQTPRPLVTRFVRLTLLTRGYLHLDQVEVYGAPA